MKQVPRIFSGVQETLLIPLAARAVARERFPKLGFKDPAAERLGHLANFDLGRFQRDASSMCSALLRAKWFDRKIEAFLRANRNAFVVSLGCGLDTRYDRLLSSIGSLSFTWIDIDFPEVIAIRRAFIPSREHVRTIGCDITTPGWFRKIDCETETSLIIACEGVLMYLRPNDVATLLSRIAVRFRACASVELLFDYASLLMMHLGRFHPSMKKISFEHNAASPFRSSLAQAGDITKFGQWHIDEETDEAAHVGMRGRALAGLHRIITGGRLIYGCAHAGCDKS